MVDTMRTIAALQVLLADNTSGDISPQDIRDFLLSFKARGAGIYISTPAATTLALNTPKKVAGTTTLISGAVDFDMPENNRLRYLGAEDIFTVCFAGVSLTSASSNQNTTMSMARNGSVSVQSKGQRKIGTGSDIGRGSVFGMGIMSTNEYMEAWIENNTGGNDITYENMTMGIVGWVI